jgi:hypothetical protein
MARLRGFAPQNAGFWLVEDRDGSGGFVCVVMMQTSQNTSNSRDGLTGGL